MRVLESIYCDTRCEFCVRKTKRYDISHGQTWNEDGYECKIKNNSFVEGLDSHCTKLDQSICPIYKLKRLKELH